MNLTYKQSTHRLGIPVHDYGDRILPEVELRRFQIIENMLLAGTHGIRNAVFDDGLFSINQETDTTYVVTLSATGHEPSAKGLVSGTYFEASPSLSWKGLTKGFVHYLYLRGTSDIFVDASAVTEISSIYSLEGDNVLIAVADCHCDQPKVDPYPDGKLYVEDLGLHMNDVENPHGKIVIQDELFIRKKLALHSPEGESAEVEVLVDGKPVLVPAGALAGAAMELAGRKVVTVDFLSAGNLGRVVSVSDVGKILFVQVSRRFSGSMTGTLGETAVGYHGEDQQLHLPGEFSFYNSGDMDIPLRALVYCG